MILHATGAAISSAHSSPVASIYVGKKLNYHVENLCELSSHTYSRSMWASGAYVSDDAIESSARDHFLFSFNDFLSSSASSEWENWMANGEKCVSRGCAYTVSICERWHRKKVENSLEKKKKEHRQQQSENISISTSQSEQENFRFRREFIFKDSFGVDEITFLSFFRLLSLSMI